MFGSNSITPEMLLSGFGNFPASPHRFGVDRPMRSFLANSVASGGHGDSPPPRFI